MRNKIIISLLAIALIANGILGYFTYVQKEDINKLVEELAAARQETAVADAVQAEQLEMVRQEITTLIGENTDSINDLGEGIVANLDSINEESGRVTTLGSNLSALSTKVNGIVPGLAADDVYRQAKMSVVEINNGDETVGAGFIYDDDSHIVTAYHVIEDLIETNIRVILADGTILKASIVGSSIHSDVSILELEESTDLAPATLADSERVAIGDHALVIGHPFEENNSLTVGVVSQLNQCEDINYGGDKRLIASLIQFDAPANPGNSGGPVFNKDGDIIGMVIAGINPLLGEGMSYAVSANKIKRVAYQIIANGKFTRLYIGVFVTDMTPATAIAAGHETICGALVTGLHPSGPAEEAGVQVGDIIVAINDVIGSVTINDVGILASYLGECLWSDQPLTIRVVRGGTELTIEVERAYSTDYKLTKILPSHEYF